MAADQQQHYLHRQQNVEDFTVESLFDILFGSKECFNYVGSQFGSAPFLWNAPKGSCLLKAQLPLMVMLAGKNHEGTAFSASKFCVGEEVS